MIGILIFYVVFWLPYSVIAFHFHFDFYQSPVNCDSFLVHFRFQFPLVTGTVTATTATADAAAGADAGVDALASDAAAADWWLVS